MAISIRTVLATVSIPLFISGCLNTGNNAAVQQGTILVSEVVTVCGAMVGGQAEQRINEEWAKYPDADASRPMIETVANVLLNNPEASEEQRTSQYSKYMTCAAGLFAANEVTK